MHCQAGQWQSFGKYDIFTVIYAGNESKSVLARNLEECRDNDKNSQSVFLSFKCILARNCEGTEQLRNKINQKVQRKLYGRIKICITDS